MGLVDAVSEVFLVLEIMFDMLPSAIKQLVFICFGGTIYIAVMRGIWR